MKELVYGIIGFEEGELDFVKMGHSEEELLILRQTAKDFGATFDKKAEHFFLARNKEFAAILQVREVNPDTALITGLWINSDFITPVLEMVIVNLGLNYHTVNLRNQGNEYTFVSNGVVNPFVDPHKASSVVVRDFL